MEKIGSNRSFGIVFFVIFLFVGLWPVLNNETPRIWSILLSLIFLTLGVLDSNLLRPLKLIWLKFGEILGKLIAPVVMAAIYFIIITPIGLFLRLTGKDLLNIKFSKNSSYWKRREKNVGSMKKQF